MASYTDQYVTSWPSIIIRLGLIEDWMEDYMGAPYYPSAHILMGLLVHHIATLFSTIYLHLTH
jgi:hypothetical protein